MEIEKDFLKREIQRLTLLITSLIEKISGLNANTAQSGIEQINETLISEFDLTLQKIAVMEDSALLKEITDLHESHILKLTEVIYEIIKSPVISDLIKRYEKKKLAQKTILLIDFLDERSKVFSMKRMNIKKALQQDA